MASMILIDLGSDVKTVQDSFEKYTSLTVGTAGKDLANKYLDDTAAKLKAEIDLMIKTVEDKIQGLIDDGASNIYSALGIDESVITFTRTLIKTADTAANLASSSILKGMLMLNSFDTNNLPFSAGAAALNIIKSFADAWYLKMMKLYGLYVDMVVEFVINPGEMLEKLKLFIIDTAIKMAEDILDEQIRAYLGISLAQAKFYCRKGYSIYKQYKEQKKKESGSGKDSDSKKMTSVKGSGSKTSISASVSVNSAVLKQQLNSWLKSQRDSLYSAFCILQIKDAINDLKSTVKLMTDISLESLADNINSLDDLINMLDEMGLGDDSTAVDLSLIPSLGINDITASIQSLANTDTLMNEGKMLAKGVGNSLMTSSTLNVNVNQTKTYDITTDISSKTITVKIYTDPTKASISNKIYKVFSKATAPDKTKVFTPSECKVIQDNIISLYSQTHKGNKSIKLTKYTINIELDIADETKNNTSSKNNTGNTQQKTNSSNSNSILLLVVEEESKSKEQLNREETRRNTIAVLHTVFSLIKSIFGPFKELAKLIQNYKENKAYVRGKHYDSLMTLFQDAMKELGMDKSVKFDNSSGLSANNVMYTVRTYELYNFIKDRNIISAGELTKNISSNEANAINNWLNINDPNALKVNETGSLLYIDYDGIEAYLVCLQQQRQLAQSVISDKELAESFVDCKSIYKNGTFNNLDKVEVCEDRILYSTSKLSRYPSLIMSFKARGYNSKF